MSKGVKARVSLIVAKLELPKHGGKTATFLKKENHGREILGLYWTDKRALMWAKRRLLQCISFQSPCATTFHHQFTPHDLGEFIYNHGRMTFRSGESHIIKANGFFIRPQVG